MPALNAELKQITAAIEAEDKAAAELPTLNKEIKQVTAEIEAEGEAAETL